MEHVTQLFSGATVRDILAWHRPIASGIVAATLFLFWFVYVYFHYTFTTYVSRLASIAFIAGGAAAVTRRVIIHSPEDVSARMDRTYESVRPYVTKCVDTAVSLVTWRDYTASAKVFVLTIVTAFFGNYMRDTTLLLVALIIAFTAPVAYEKKQKEIDEVVRKVHAEIDKYLAMIKTKAVAKKSQAEKQLDDMARKAQ